MHCYCMGSILLRDGMILNIIIEKGNTGIVSTYNAKHYNIDIRPLRHN